MSNAIRFLEPYVYDGENMLQLSPGSSASDLTRKVHDVLRIMREDPAQLRARDVAAVVNDSNSQIGKKDERISHFQRVAGINAQLVTALSERNAGLDLPSPEVARALGLVHDLSNAFALYGGKYIQEEKELPLYHLALELGVPIVADAAQHNAYLEIAGMIAERTGFATIGDFSAWSDAYNNSSPDNPHSVLAMFKEYGNPSAGAGHDFAHGKGKLDLMVLSVADCLDDGKSHTVELANLKNNFDLRMADIVARNYHHKIDTGKSPTAFGVALVERDGLKRMESYLSIVRDLLATS